MILHTYCISTIRSFAINPYDFRTKFRDSREWPNLSSCFSSFQSAQFSNFRRAGKFHRRKEDRESQAIPNFKNHSPIFLSLSRVDSYLSNNNGRQEIKLSKYTRILFFGGGRERGRKKSSLYECCTNA